LALTVSQLPQIDILNCFALLFFVHFYYIRFAADGKKKPLTVRRAVDCQ